MGNESNQPCCSWEIHLNGSDEPTKLPIDMSSHVVGRNGFQCFHTEEKMKEVYRHLSAIHHVNVARPVHMFHQVDVEKANSHSYYLCMNLGEGTNLKEFIANKKEQFCNYHSKDNMKPAYSVSPLYITILRGLVQGLLKLQKTEIRPDVALESIYVVGGDNIGAEHSMVKDDEKVQVHCLYTKYFVRPKENRRRNRKARNRGTVHPMTLEWDKLAKIIRSIKGMIDLKPSDPAGDQMNSVITLMESKNMNKINQIRNHPIFWGWRKRKDLICYASDILKTLESLMRKQNTQVGAEYQSRSSWGDSMLNHSAINRAFGDNDLECLKAFEKDENLSKLKRKSDFYATNESENVNASNGSNDGNVIRRANARDANVLIDSDANKRIKLSECIHLMRNTYCHLSDMKGHPSETDISVKNAKELEKLYSQAFPKAIFCLARAIAWHEEETNKKWSKVHGKWEHGEWALHF